MISLDDIRQAHFCIADGIRRTHCEQSTTLSSIVGVDLFIKFENMQFTASFKERGALNKLLKLQSDGCNTGVIAMSAGNHAKAVAYHASRLQIPATIVMPRFTPNVKAEDTKRLGADVVLTGESLAEAGDYAQQLAKEQDLTLIHPYNDPYVMAGQGTVAVEMLEDVPDLDVIVVPIGGGGLISGMAIAAKTIKPDIKIVGIQSETFPAVHQLLRGEPVRVGGSTIAEGIAVKYPGDLTLEVIKSQVDQVLLVSEEVIEQAVSAYINIEKTVAEGAGAAALAGVMQHPEYFKGQKVGVVLCGANIDSRVLSFILMRDLVHQGRIVRLKVLIDDSPGSLSRVAAMVGDLDGNIIDVDHQRVFTHVKAKEATLSMSIEVKNRKHGQKIRDALLSVGYQAILMADE